MLVVFGASGDLVHRKLLPALAALAADGHLPSGFSVVGVARTEWSEDDFRAKAVAAAVEPNDAWTSLVGSFRYITGEYADDLTFDRLKIVLDEVDRDCGTEGNRVHYLATVPKVFDSVIAALGRHNFNRGAREARSLGS